ncbi:unnamed protein product, partial [Pleuronectes platessa]
MLRKHRHTESGATEETDRTGKDKNFMDFLMVHQPPDMVAHQDVSQYSQWPVCNRLCEVLFSIDEIDLEEIPGSAKEETDSLRSGAKQSGLSNWIGHGTGDAGHIMLGAEQSSSLHPVLVAEAEPHFSFQQELPAGATTAIRIYGARVRAPTLDTHQRPQGHSLSVAKVGAEPEDEPEDSGVLIEGEEVLSGL